MLVLFCSSFLSFLVLQSSRWGRESWVVWCVLNFVSVVFFGSSWQCHGWSVVCGCGISLSYSLTFWFSCCITIQVRYSLQRTGTPVNFKRFIPAHEFFHKIAEQHNILNYKKKPISYFLGNYRNKTKK